MKKIILAFSLGLIIVFGLNPAAFALGLQIEKRVFAPGEQITVQFSAPADFAKNAWIGLIPGNVPHGSEAENDKYDLAYIYLEGRTSGSVAFKAPGKPGAYDLRLNDTDNNGVEVASVSFMVSSAEAAGKKGSLALEKTVFAPGEKITVHFTTDGSLPKNAWVGLLPANVPHGDESRNDQSDLAYQYVEGRTSGVMVFSAPKKTGEYDFRLNSTDNNGVELATVAFTVR